MEKNCGICKKDYIGNGIKYCSTKCAYEAMEIKAKERKNKLCNCNGRILWVSSITMYGFVLGFIFGLAIGLLK
jgi:hypothetical protein